MKRTTMRTMMSMTVKRTTNRINNDNDEGRTRVKGSMSIRKMRRM